MATLAFFGGPADLAIIFVVALVVFGPKKLPEVGRQIGQAMREFHKIRDEMMGTANSVRDEVESIYRPIVNPPAVSQATSSPTVERVVAHQPIDQAGEDLMAPAVPAVSHAGSSGHDVDAKGF